MKGYNKVHLIGNLGQDPDVRYTGNGNAVANLRLACNERRKVRDEWTDHVEWVSVVVFGKTAENCREYLSKGSPLFVEGRLQTRDWEDNNGNKRKSTEVVAHQVVFLGKGGDGGSGSRSTAPRDEPPLIDDDDIPF